MHKHRQAGATISSADSFHSDSALSAVQKHTKLKLFATQSRMHTNRMLGEFTNFFSQISYNGTQTHQVTFCMNLNLVTPCTGDFFQLPVAWLPILSRIRTPRLVYSGVKWALYSIFQNIFDHTWVILALRLDPVENALATRTCGEARSVASGASTPAA